MRWDPEETAEHYTITYRHRGAPGDVKQIRASSIRKLGKSYFTISENSEGEESIIPFHRILEIRSLDNTVIWKSRKLTS
jgi:uncharacterized protein (UPF0248 family)